MTALDNAIDQLSHESPVDTTEVYQELADLRTQLAEVRRVIESTNSMSVYSTVETGYAKRNAAAYLAKYPAE